MTDEKKGFWMGVAAVGLALVSISISGWGLYRISTVSSDVLSISSAIEQSEASDENNPDLASDVESVASRLDLVERYLTARQISYEGAAQYFLPARSAELGISMRLPSEWTAEWRENALHLNPPEYYRSYGHSSPCVIVKPSIEEGLYAKESFAFWKKAQPGDGCEGEEHCISVGSRERVSDGEWPIILLGWYGGWMGRSQVAVIELPTEEVAMSNFWSGDVINHIQLAQNEALQDVCLEIAKTIEPLQEN